VDVACRHGIGVLTLAGHTNSVDAAPADSDAGSGAAMNAPAWQSIVSELVPRPQLAAAVALNSAGFNVARAIGPAVVAGSGLVGSRWAFLLNAVSFLAVVAVLYRWQRPPADRAGGGRATRCGASQRIAYVRDTPTLHV